ncbi:MAG: Trk system potassium transporter TrkA [Oscillospiraceae bacterium]|nr:Trk system potassium transporter TrkA [Oscillospiraceae bacterium]MBQ1768964.1 Trk system potassium transporter TrkA [Oscillospiraceae bacterium]MBQ3985974.1 Trk system potassium transporter TrkA [Oscillospiraceae bacterium]MBQ5503564.1 Trk system potassium transporter TrkA [Oscillospiraceae bacterium]
MPSANLTPVDSGLSIIIVGCGKVGSTITAALYREGHDITVIDKNPATVQALTNSYDVMGIVGNGASYSVQMEAGIEFADLIIAVTGSDELNLLCCTVAKRVGHCDAIARVRNPDYAEEIPYLREQLGLTMIINPELEAASEIARILYLPRALAVSPFAKGQAELVRFRLPEENELCDKKLMDLGALVKNIRFCAIERGGEVYIPDGSFTLSAGDTVTFVASARAAATFFDSIGLRSGKIGRVMIIGGGKAAYYLARQLIAMGKTVKIIETNRARCEELENLIPDAIIINGNGSDEDLLQEEGIRTADAFVPLTGMDEENILLTLYAREVSGAKAITKINRINFRNVIQGLDLGSVVYPKYITSEAIIAYVRAKKASIGSGIETLYHLFDSRAEAIEFKVGEVDGVTNIPLKDLKTKDNLIIASINHLGKAIVPGGGDCISAGDTVVVVTTNTGLHDIRDILG